MLGRRDIELGPLRVRMLQSGTDRTGMDLSLYVEENDDTLNLTMRYKSELFERTTMAAMLARYLRILQSLVDRPEQTIGALCSSITEGGSAP